MKKKENLLNIPNCLTLIRLVLSFFIFFLILNKDNTLAFILFIASTLTELDGTIARRFKLTTSFGKNFDEITDIFWLGGVFSAFTITKAIPLWFAAALLSLALLSWIIAITISKKTKKPVDISFHEPLDLVAGGSILLYFTFLFFGSAYSMTIGIISLVLNFAVIVKYARRAI